MSKNFRLLSITWTVGGAFTMFHDPDPLDGRFTNTRLIWMVILLVAGMSIFAIVWMQRHRALPSAVVKSERKAVVTELPKDLQGDDTYLKIAQRPKAPTPPDLSDKVTRLEQELAMMRAERNHAPSSTSPVATPAVATTAAKPATAAPDPETQRRQQAALDAARQAAQELKAARKSPLSAIRHDKDDDKTKTAGLLPLRSKHTVFAGEIIPLVMKNALNSESPDTCVAHVAHDVYDSLTGDVVLIPHGSRVNCTYSSAVFGQERLVPKANLLTLPNGETLKLDEFTIATASGQAGLDGEVDNHWGRILASIPLSVLRAGAQAAPAAMGNDVGSRAAGVVVQDATQETTQAARRSMLTNPTIHVDRAKIGVIILPKALELRPWLAMD
jgi:type IV secretory pathway VirB10-like protein